MSKEIERRFIPRGAGEVRASKRDDGKIGIVGTAAVTNSLSDEIFGFREKIAPGAFESALKRSDIRGLFNHDPNYVLGRVKSGTMTVRADDRGLHYEIVELPESRADVAEAIQRGDVDGNSFAFTVEKDSWEYRKDGSAIRTIEEFGELFDVGPVTYPAYPATTVSARAKKMAEKRASDPATATAPKFQKGDRVVAIVGHMDDMKGMAGSVNEANAGSPPYYAIDFDEPMGTGNPHKWLNEDEIKAAPADDEMRAAEVCLELERILLAEVEQDAA